MVDGDSVDMRRIRIKEEFIELRRSQNPSSPKFSQQRKEFDEEEQGTKAFSSSAPCLLISSRARVTRVSNRSTTLIN